MGRKLSFLATFTFHYVSIKSADAHALMIDNLDLHSTMYLLNLRFHVLAAKVRSYLHSTMYLLNLDGIALTNATTILFTFHYVSIKSKISHLSKITFTKFTFHYVSIKSTASLPYSPDKVYLHSTMYLLNLQYFSSIWILHFVFTFHYVSIKSHTQSWQEKGVIIIYIPLCIY